SDELGLPPSREGLGDRAANTANHREVDHVHPLQALLGVGHDLHALQASLQVRTVGRDDQLSVRLPLRVFLHDVTDHGDKVTVRDHEEVPAGDSLEHDLRLCAGGRPETGCVTIRPDLHASRRGGQVLDVEAAPPLTIVRLERAKQDGVLVRDEGRVGGRAEDVALQHGALLVVNDSLVC
ncbi:MAG: hypothetical protein UZ21_OP11001000860, partial [Microgenomates bacterium OLB22]